MISNPLSLVEALRPASDELAAQVEQYLAADGNIEAAEPIGYKPCPSPTAIRCRRRRSRLFGVG